ncbi:tRNA-splicing endonuclease subunit Sen34 [Cryptotermes secundus]|uniref:tRNA-splicing endonuclease subunit Sen34 n=1 Tax=Cryptotermes secundus TaxID=105785 RepID=A0A2J7RA58_9NEOP|nr:tRNA-splicing endonuclease subunit Sen34 [Cryptotermes secundus]PNF37704.1 tRNA-splicing endonuclease subunit Sen34 [Cryptotermes secundus]
MITLTLINGKVYTWNADDWQKLREEYRIVGALIGCLAHLPRQDSFLGLPMVLLPEEVTLLHEQKLVRLVSYSFPSYASSNAVRQKFQEYRKTMYMQQVECFKEERKRQVTSMIDHIVEGKRRKLLGLGHKRKKAHNENESSVQDQSQSKNYEMDTDHIDREALLRDELDKIKCMDENSTLVQTFTASVWLYEEDATPVEWQYPVTSTETLRYKTFKDLWEKGYYITGGQKFGADFLVYPGDPIKFHAQFLVVCTDSNEALPATDLVALGRLGTSVRKTVVLSSLSDDGNTVLYQSLKWNATF